MAIISMANATSIKIKIDKGMDVNGERILKSRTYGSVKAKATSEDIVDFIYSLMELQDHTLVGLNRIDNTSLAQ